jgi:hypothetical protein
MVPGAQRKAAVAFYVHSHGDEEALRRGMIAAVDEALKGNSVPECVVFARHIDEWQRPYQAACLVGRSTPEPAA